MKQLVLHLEMLPGGNYNCETKLKEINLLQRFLVIKIFALSNFNFKWHKLDQQKQFKVLKLGNGSICIFYKKKNYIFQNFFIKYYNFHQLYIL